MKKLISLALALSMALTLAACGNSSKPSNSGNAAPPAASQPAASQPSGSQTPEAPAFVPERDITLVNPYEAGGTSDIPVAEEAALTAQVLGNAVTRLYDVGVAGLHRTLAHLDELMSASVVIAIAGMEGALASVIGGLVDCPVIAVPTSVGYGASFHGLSALLSMLNSCASGVSVVNIDNGFGAGFLAGRINHMTGGAR